MEKMKKLFNGYKGIIIFYIIVAILSLMITKKIDRINSQAKNVTEAKTYYAIVFYK